MLGENTYSNLVSWLKIILPLAALGLLSTLFLLSRSIDPTESIPFAEIDLAERAAQQGVSQPYFSGATESGDLIAFAATSARPDPDNPHRALADSVKSWINLTNGTLLQISADSGILDQPADLADLAGNVVFSSSLGYTVRTQAIQSSMREIWAETSGPVQADGPPGQFSAGKMILQVEPGTDDVQLLFTNGVKLVYDPRKNRE